MQRHQAQVTSGRRRGCTTLGRIATIQLEDSSEGKRVMLGPIDQLSEAIERKALVSLGFFVPVCLRGGLYKAHKARDGTLYAQVEHPRENGV